MTDVEVAGENRRWLEELSAVGPVREDACRRLHALLLRVARREAVRRAPSLHISGPELDDIAHQAASDALMTLSGRLHRFRGESRFTTWAIKFVIFDVANKMNRHHWHHFDVPFELEDWAGFASRLDVAPEEAVQVNDLVATVRQCVDQSLSDRQRLVFLAVVVHGTPIGVLAERLGTTNNALYKVLFDARKKVRAALVATGHVVEDRSA